MSCGKDLKTAAELISLLMECRLHYRWPCHKMAERGFVRSRHTLNAAVPALQLMLVHSGHDVSTHLSLESASASALRAADPDQSQFDGEVILSLYWALLPRNNQRIGPGPSAHADDLPRVLSIDATQTCAVRQQSTPLFRPEKAPAYAYSLEAREK